MASDAIQFGVPLTGDGDLVEFAQTVEGLGFDSVWVGDHVLMPNGGEEGYTKLAAMAAATKHITIGARVIVLPLRHPLMNAKMATQIDIMSHGRFIYGVGIGGDYPPEFENLQIPRNERGRRGNENLEAMMRLFHEDRVTYEGKYYQLHDVTLSPKPVQQPHPPIWMGGRAPEAVQRAAKYADGWFPNLNTVEGLRERLQEIHRLADEAKRDISHFKVAVVARTFIGKNHDVAHAEAAARGGPPGTRATTDWDAMVDRYAAHGTAKDIIEYLERYVAEGATHFVFNLNADYAHSPADRLENDLNVLAKDVFPYFRGKH